MKCLRHSSKQILSSVSVFAMASYLVATPASAECPFVSPFGADDEIGASQTQTPTKALEAIKLVDTGRVFGLAHVMEEETIPKPFGRIYDNGMFTFEFAGQLFSQGPIIAYMGQMGTQIDALGHAGHPIDGGLFYNCIPRDEVEAVDNDGNPNPAFPSAGDPDNPLPDGTNDPGTGELKKLGVETIRPIFTRAVLIDFKNYLEIEGKAKGEILPANYVITLDDVTTVLEEENVDPPNEGDMVIFYTGWDEKYGDGDVNEAGTGNNLLGNQSPGIGLEVAEWLAERGVVAAGSDNSALEALEDGVAADNTFPEGHPLKELGDGLPFPGHFRLLSAAGIHIGELMLLTPFADAMLEKKNKKSSKKNPYEFLFVYSPVPLKGMAGSPGRPLAVD